MASTDPSRSENAVSYSTSEEQRNDENPWRSPNLAAADAVTSNASFSVNYSSSFDDPYLVDVGVAGAGDRFNYDYFNFILNEVAVPLLFGLITVLGVVGNTLVVYVIVTRERMRTVTNLLLLNLAIADLLFVLVVPPFTAYQFATARWPFGVAACRAMHYLVNVTAYTTVYTLVLVSVVRYMTIVHTVTTARLRTRRNVALMIVAIWVVMLAVNVPIWSSYTVNVGPYGWPDCEHRSIDTAKRIFATLFVFAYLLPLAVIGCFSAGILHHITKHRSEAIDRSTR